MVCILRDTASQIDLQSTATLSCDFLSESPSCFQVAVAIATSVVGLTQSNASDRSLSCAVTRPLQSALRTFVLWTVAVHASLRAVAVF